MSTDLMLKMIMEDLTIIKNKLQTITRTEETVRIQQKQISIIFEKLDKHEEKIANNENAITSNFTNSNNMRSAIAWLSAFISAFLIAIYLSNTKPVKAAIINKEPHIKILKVKEKGKE